MARNSVTGQMVRKSMVKAIKTAFPEFGHVLIGSQDLDHDGLTLPYCFLENAEEDLMPYHVGNRQIAFQHNLNVVVACQSVAQYEVLPGQVHQFLMTTNAGNNTPGTIVLWDFDNVPETNEGEIKIMFNGTLSPYPDITEKREWKNLKFAAFLPLICEVIKTKENRLI